MKRVFLKFALILVLITGYSYSQFENWNVLSVNRELFGIKFTSLNNAWIFGGDFRFKSNDAGNNWSNPLYTNPPIGMQGNSYYPNFYCFPDSVNGWACSYNSNLTYTTNGGNSWLVKNSIVNTTNSYFGVYFKDRSMGWAAGKTSNSKGVLIKTTNGGLNWSLVNNNIRWEVRALHMLNESTGFILTKWIDTVGITRDGGSSWEYMKAGNGQELVKIFFVDSLNGWLLGNPWYLSRTTNGGYNWYTHNYSVPGNSKDFFFLNNLTGWIVGSYGFITKTTNGGINWILQRGYQCGSPDCDLFSIAFKDENIGVAVGHASSMIKSTNGGAGWSYQNTGLAYISQVKFLNENTGWMISGNYLHKTTNRGYNWVNTNVLCKNLFFSDLNNGFLCGNNGLIMKTINGGLNWINCNYGNQNYNSIFCVNNDYIYCCGNNGTIIKTTNSGLNWIELNSNIIRNLRSVYFTDFANGCAAGDGGYVITTTNSGLNWISNYPSGEKDYTKVKFINSQTGFVIGSHTFYYNFNYYCYRVILKTIDQGFNWTEQVNEYTSGYNYFNDICFINSNTGWVLSRDNRIWKTTNSGDNWIYYSSPVNENLVSIDFIETNKGWIGTENGSFLSTSSPIGIQISSQELPKNFALSQNYPNPFNPQTKIKFDVPKTSFTKLIIYDLLGREVATLVNEELKPGTYETNWDASNFSTGVYFYKIIAGDFVETKKMVLMK